MVAHLGTLWDITRVTLQEEDRTGAGFQTSILFTDKNVSEVELKGGSGCLLRFIFLYTFSLIREFLF